jgi:hypothetical protein
VSHALKSQTGPVGAKSLSQNTESIGSVIRHHQLLTESLLRNEDWLLSCKEKNISVVFIRVLKDV